jgi:3-isopropylmalate dehydrogenase
VRVALLPGDGIGPEVIAEAVRVIDALNLGIAWEELSVGAGEFLKSGDPLPPATLECAAACDAILLGAMGLPEVRWPNGTELTPQIDLREKLDLYAGWRPIRLLNPTHSPLKAPGTLDLLLLRENTEGMFFSRTAAVDFAAPHQDDTLRITRRGSERLFHAAFQKARQRRGRVTLVDKANVLPSMAYFRRCFDEVAAHYPDIETERVYVDAMALYLVQNPARFDVVVTENLFGDILSDQAAGLIGGMGFAPSADIGEKHAVFQPSHGTAPDIAGKGIANPVATILSGAMMLEWLGLPEAAWRIVHAVDRVFATDARSTAGTKELGQRVVEALE